MINDVSDSDTNFDNMFYFSCFIGKTLNSFPMFILSLKMKVI